MLLKLLFMFLPLSSNVEELPTLEVTYKLTIQDYYKIASATYDIPVQVFEVQAREESSNWKSRLAKRCNNGYGHYYKGKFISYSSKKACIFAHAKLLQKWRPKNHKDPIAWFKAFKSNKDVNKHYAENPRYVDNLCAIYKTLFRNQKSKNV